MTNSKLFEQKMCHLSGQVVKCAAFEYALNQGLWGCAAYETKDLCCNIAASNVLIAIYLTVFAMLTLDRHLLKYTSLYKYHVRFVIKLWLSLLTI